MQPPHKVYSPRLAPVMRTVVVDMFFVLIERLSWKDLPPSIFNPTIETAPSFPLILTPCLSDLIG